MLDVAVLLVASATLYGVAGVFSVPDSPPQLTIESSLVDPWVHDPSRSPGHHDDMMIELSGLKADPSLVPRLAGQSLLQQLALLDSKELAGFVATNPEAVRQLLLDPPAADKTEAWWRGLQAGERQNLRIAAPEIVGNLPGVPFATRDVANRYFLSQTISDLEAQVAAGIGRGAETEVHERLAMLHEVERVLGSRTSVPGRSLINLDTVWPGRAAVVLGDLCTADYVSYLVPGMFFTIEGQVGDWTDTAARLHADQTSWLQLLSKTDAEAADKTVATVAWMGYETPNLFTVGSEELADEGALYLNSAMDSLYNARKDHRPFVSLLAHSYGSTAAMKALATGNFEVDSFAVVGSPGSSVQSVDDLHVKNRNVFVGEASWDPVIGTAFFGSNPGAASYGAHRMSVSGGIDRITKEVLNASFGHNEYFAVGSESLRNMALIGIDQGTLVTDGSSSDVEKTLALAQ